MTTISTASYVICKEGLTAKAINGTTGIVESQNIDSTVVINYAISFIPSGGKIFIRAGTYNVNPIIPKSDITIEAEGRTNTTLKLNNNINDYIFKTVSGNISNFHVSGLHLDGNRTNNTMGGGINIFAPTNCTFENMRIENCAIYGIKTNGNGYGTRLLNSMIAFCKIGTSISNCDENIISNNTFSRCDQSGYEGLYGMDNILGNTFVENIGNGLYLRDSNNYRVESNIFDNSGGNGAYLLNVGRSTVTGNMFVLNSSSKHIPNNQNKFDDLRIEYAGKHNTITANIFASPDVKYHIDFTNPKPLSNANFDNTKIIGNSFITATTNTVDTKLNLPTDGSSIKYDPNWN